MTATDELRRLLDERGVEWREGLGNEHRVETFFDDMNGHTALFVDFGDGNPFGSESELSADLTPAQAVEATLGRGTCRDTGEDEERFCCSECGSRSHIATEYRKFDEYGNKIEHFLFVGNPRFCPSCGRRVVDA